MSGTLALAASIAAMDRDELRGLLSVRQVGALQSVNNPLGLAIELLRSDAVAAALHGLDRASIAALLEAGDGHGIRSAETVASLRGRGLLGLDAKSGEAARPVALPEVTSALRGFEVAEMLELAEDRRPAEPVSTASDTSAWFGPALAATVRSAALLRALPYRPARLSRKGAVTVVALRELALVTHDAPEATGRLTQLLQFAGLAVPFSPPGGQALLAPSTEAENWLSLPQPRRWLALARALAARASVQLRRAIELSGEDLRFAVDVRLEEEFPLLPRPLLEEASEWADQAEQLGLAIGGRLTPTARGLLAPGADPETAHGAALAAAERDFPAPAPGIYLQPDLSVIVPGPLAPADERALGEIADTEQLGVASTLRLSPGSLSRALRLGYGIGSIRDLLERLSLTGIPQPLDFLLSDLQRAPAAKRPEDPRMAAWLDHVGARIDPEPGYPADGPRAGAGAPVVDDPAAAASDPAALLLEAAVDRIHSAASANSGAGELTHRLELAIRDRSPVRVTATGGPEERTFVLLPVSLASGRLRATDQAAGVERTLPVSAITAVEAA